MAFDAHSNFAYGTVATAPSPAVSGTSLTLSAGAGARMPAVPFNASVWPPGVLALATNAEIVRVTARAGDVVTLLRAAEPPTAARAILVGDQFAATITAKTLQDVEGPVEDARLSGNVPLLNAPNVFTAPQQVSTPGSGSLLRLVDTSQPTDLKTFQIVTSAQQLRFSAINDAFTAATGAVTIDRGGVLSTPAGLGATPLNASQASTGTLPDARLSANVPLLASANVFTGLINRFETVRLHHPLAPVNGGLWSAGPQSAGDFVFAALNDAGSSLGTPATLTRAGSLGVAADYYEKGRTIPIGHWTDIAFNAGNFGANGGGWTVTATQRNSYTVVGKTLFYQLIINGTSAITGTPSNIFVLLPFALVAGQSGLFFYNIVAGSNGIGTWVQPTQDAFLRLQRDPFGTPFAATANAYIYVNLTIQML